MDENKELSDIFENKKKRKKRKTVLVLIMTVIFLAALAYAALKFFFVYKGLDIQESKMYTYQEIENAVNIKAKTPLYKINKKKLAEKLQLEFPFLTDVKVSYSLPYKLKISFTETLGEISLTLGEDEFYINRELYVIKKHSVKDKEYKRIKLYTDDVKKCIVGENIEFSSENVTNYLGELMSLIEKKDLEDKIDMIDIRDQFSIRLKYLSRFNVLLGEGEDITYKLDLMKRIGEELDPNVLADVDVSDASTAYVRVTGQAN